MKAGLEIRADLKALRNEFAQARKDFREFNTQAMASANGVKMVEKTTNDASKSVGSLTTSMGKLGGAFAIGGLAAAAAIKLKDFFVTFVRGSIQASSTMTELDSKARVVFGKTFAGVQGQVKAVAAEVGRASSVILQMATDMGAIIKSFGIAGPLMENMSVQLAKLAVDMASFHNTADEDAFGALRSGLTGETEPLKRYGIVLTDTNLQLFALEKGLKQKVSAMNQAQKTALRYEFIMARTADAQGDAARTADSYANQTRRLAGEMTTLQEQMGKAATPVLADALGFLSQTLQGTRLFVRALVQDLQSLIGVMASIPGAGLIKKAVGGAVNIAKNFIDPLGIGRGILGKVGDRMGEMKAAEANADLNDRMDALKGFENLGGGISLDKDGGGKSAAEKHKALLEDIAQQEEKILSALDDQADANKDQLESRKEELELRKEIGTITERETRELERINRRIAFQKDVVDEAKKAWQEQADEVKKVEDRVSDLNAKIAEERKQLVATLAEIDEDAARTKGDKAADLLGERDELQGKLNRREGMSAKEQERLDEIERTLSTAGSGVLAEGQRLSGLNDFQRIDEETKRKRQDAEEKANVRLSELQAELDAENQKLATVRTAEQLKKQTVVDALNERKDVTLATFRLLEEETQRHVTKQIEQFNTLKASLQALSGSNSSLVNFERGNAASIGGFAKGGYTGPGNPSDPAGTVHKEEFVFDAQATRAIGVPQLQRMMQLAKGHSMPRFQQPSVHVVEKSPTQHITFPLTQTNDPYRDRKRAEFLALGSPIIWR